MKTLQYICVSVIIWHLILLNSQLDAQDLSDLEIENRLDIDNIYSHSDYKTTAILNFISGEESLPDVFCVEYAEKIVRNLELVQRGEISSSNSKSFLEELESKLDSIWQEQEGIMPYCYGPDYQYVSNIINKYYGSENLINAIWIMNYTHGNPRIDFSSSFSEEYSYGNRTYYDPSTNTIYLGIFPTMTVTQFLLDWMTELAHADQYTRYSKNIMSERQKNEDIFLDSLCEVYEYVRISKMCECSSASIIDRIKEIFYINSNLIKGFNSIEYEAHQINGKEFWEEFFQRLEV